MIFLPREPEYNEYYPPDDKEEKKKKEKEDDEKEIEVTFGVGEKKKEEPESKTATATWSFQQTIPDVSEKEKKKISDIRKRIKQTGRKIGKKVERDLSATIKEVKHERKRRRAYPYGAPKVYRAPRGFNRKVTGPSRKLLESGDRVFFTGQVSAISATPHLQPQQPVELIEKKNFEFGNSKNFDLIGGGSKKGLDLISSKKPVSLIGSGGKSLNLIGGGKKQVGLFGGSGRGLNLLGNNSKKRRLI